VASSVPARVPSLFFDSRGPKLVKPEEWIKFWKIRVGDQVEVTEGKCRGQAGEVIQCDYLRNLVKVKGVNLRKIRTRSGPTIQVEKKIHYSNVALLDPADNKPTRVKWQMLEGGDMQRVAKRSGSVIPMPEAARKILDTSNYIDGPKDTPPEVALEKTYNYFADVEKMRLIRQTLTKYNRDGPS